MGGKKSVMTRSYSEVKSNSVSKNVVCVSVMFSKVVDTYEVPWRNMVTS